MSLALFILAVLMGGALLPQKTRMLREPGAGLVMLLRICLAIGVGIGLASYSFFISRVIGSAQRSLMEIAMCALAGVAIYAASAIWMLERNVRRERPTATLTRIRRATGIAVLVTSTAALVGAIFMSLTAPYGAWDAWAIWNLHA